ncbi:MAG: hypothetical protein KDJ38_12540 [Gammaproteobacteria bacterium]|nr:hypothetical protein [Gammaproteobacteria bacterium]
MNRTLASAFLITLLTAPTLYAGEADVIAVEINPLGGLSFRVDATVQHADEGWSHYANRWDVLDPNGKILGSRILAHPHDNEQPFTRSLTLDIPADVQTITVRAQDLVHGFGGKTVSVAVPGR